MVAMTSAEGKPGQVAIPEPGEYRLDPEASKITFKTRHMFGLAPVHGTFRLGDGTVRVADPVEESSARLTIPASSFDTGTSARDKTVLSGTYLDVERHPTISFASTGLERGDAWVLHGVLTVCGESRDIDVSVEQAQVSDGAVTVRAHSRVDRYAFGLTAMKGMTGRYLNLTFEVVARKQE